MEKFVFAKSVQGSSHKKKERESKESNVNRLFPCQDRSLAEELESEDKTPFSFLAVSDGHGGDEYFRSEKGADFAIQVFKNILIRSMNKIKEEFEKKNFDFIKSQLANSLIKNWREKIDEDLKNNQITDDEYATALSDKPEVINRYKSGKDLYSIYGCTLVAFFATETFWYAIQIGDGDFAISYDGKNFEMPIPEDENCFLNQTTSLCDENAKKEFRYANGDRIPKVVFCSTDGVSNSFSSENELKKIYAGVSNLITSLDFPKCQNFECESFPCNLKCKQELISNEITRYLPILSEKGSGDDISFACYINMNEEDKNKISGDLFYLMGNYIENNNATVVVNKLKSSKLWLHVYKNMENNSCCCFKPKKAPSLLEMKIFCFELAKKHSNINAAYKLGIYYKERNEQEKALENMKFASEKGHSDAMFQLAEWYEKGYGGNNNQDEADIWYEKAADAGNEQAKKYIEEKIKSQKELVPEEPQKNIEDLNDTKKSNPCDGNDKSKQMSENQLGSPNNGDNNFGGKKESVSEETQKDINDIKKSNSYDENDKSKQMSENQLESPNNRGNNFGEKKESVSEETQKDINDTKKSNSCDGNDKSKQMSENQLGSPNNKDNNFGEKKESIPEKTTQGLSTENSKVGQILAQKLNLEPDRKESSLNLKA